MQFFKPHSKSIKSIFYLTQTEYLYKVVMDHRLLLRQEIQSCNGILQVSTGVMSSHSVYHHCYDYYISAAVSKLFVQLTNSSNKKQNNAELKRGYQSESCNVFHFSSSEIKLITKVEMIANNKWLK